MPTDSTYKSGSGVPTAGATAIPNRLKDAQVTRRRFLEALAAIPLGSISLSGRGNGLPVRIQDGFPKPLAVFSAGQAASFDLSSYFLNYKPGVTKVRLRANIHDERRPIKRSPNFVSLESQFKEYAFAYPMLRYDGTAAGTLSAGASSVRLQIEATDGAFDDPAAVVVSTIARIHVDSPLARIKHGLDTWASFDELTRDVQGGAANGSAPRGRTDLIGAVFEITPGMFSEDINGSYDYSRAKGAAATIQFPCAIKALDLRHRPVFRSISGERDIVLVQAIHLPPIDGEVVLQDIVVRDNRGWYNTGSGGVRIKDRFPGRAVRIECCEFVRCQNAVAGGALGQTLRIYDCRVVDCGFDAQAHSFYISPEWLEFFGNHVSYSPGNRLARAHQLKTRALNARILGNKFETNDCAASYLIDISNGGNYEIGGNLFHFGSASDNRGATLVAYAPEGAGGDHGAPPFVFAPGRQFSLVARNNTMISGFNGGNGFFVVDNRSGMRAEGTPATTFPDPLLLVDNVYHSAGPGRFLIPRERLQPGQNDIGEASAHPGNSQAGKGDFLGNDPQGFALKAAILNSAGPYAARRFTGKTYLGTGSAPHIFTARGAV